MSIDEAFRVFPDGAPLASFDAAHGAGAFGRWETDTEGAPCFHYAPKPGHEGDHWHLVGNDRISATVHSGGYAQLYDWSRGGKILNRWHPASGNYAGGFHWVALNGALLCTLRERLPPGARQSLYFSVGYAERVTEWMNLRIVERIDAPPGGAARLESRIAIANLSGAPIKVAVIAYWCANLHQLTPAPIMTYGTHRIVDAWRRRLNKRFRLQAAWNPETQSLEIRHTPLRKPRHAPDAPAIIDMFPPALHFAAHDAEAFSFSTDSVAMQNLGAMDGPLSNSTEERPAVEGMPVLFRWERSIGPGETIDLGISVHIGALHMRAPSPPPAPKRAEMEFAVPQLPAIDRELRWHSYYLQAGSYYSEYFDAHFVDQGSAYSYMQGLSGAPRDFALFIMPLVYLRPDLAKDMLRFVLRLQRAADGGFPYAVFGHGKVSGGGIHSWSSDLDIFVLWALSEYVGLTRDFAFLEEELAYYPREAARRGTVLEHARRAFDHLRDCVGRGKHGLIRAGTGDWNDVLLAYSRIPALTARRGESALNAGLACVALPALAGVLHDAAPEFAAALRSFAEGQCSALHQLWNGEWMARGYLGYGEARLGDDRLFLDAQSFPVIAGLWDMAQCDKLFENIRTRCIASQPAGALCLYPPMRGLLLHPGSDTNGGTWAAIDAWLAWAWSRHDPAAGWDFFQRSLLAARAQAYPDTWYGVWSGPDSYNAHYHAKPNETFDFNFTPMAKYPVMNMNRHAGPLLAAIKMAGIEARRDGIQIDPHFPFDEFVLRTPVIGVSSLEGVRKGYYRPASQGPGELELSVRPPRSATGRWRVEVGGTTCAWTSTDTGLLQFPIAWDTAAGVEWRITSI